MPLESLSQFDSATANVILTAAALSTTPDPGIGLVEEFSQYQQEVASVLTEVRKKLKLRENDQSARARALIDKFLSDAFDHTIFQGSAAESALSRAGKAGRLSPGAYAVVQPEGFTKQFYHLAVTKQLVRETIQSPDDYQHLMTEDTLPGESDLVSVFMRQSGGQNHDPNWLLVQTLRRGYEQIAQSAFRVYPGDVDLTRAQTPVEVLAAFCDVFGVNVHAGDRVGKFIELVKVPKNPVSQHTELIVRAETLPGVQYFFSWSHRAMPDQPSITLGLVYCIDLAKYRASLSAHGASVR